MKRKRKIPGPNPETQRLFDEAQQRLAARIAYHRRKIEEERAAREKR